ncbi:adenylate kinase [Schizopora paradoxa]|uniref:Adenylate kinase n=1 Tax=Schizopora paradoxa TaxID=27342 RepID=A0A0H2RMB3_9AGAM|nr:adenylate kinase [Schizopora paradoxa]
MTPSTQKALPFSLNISSNTAGSSSEPHDSSAHLRMIMFGRPGAGKGTLSARLVKEFDIVTISTGDLLRQQIAQKTDVGRQAKEIVARGDLLPDELMLKVVSSELDNLRDKHWILDGFPRTIGQGQLLDTHLRLQNMPLTLLTLLAVPIELLRARIASRFIHPGSGRVYNLIYNPPRVPGQDDVTGEPLVQRPDDTPEVYERRLQRYDAETAPLLGYYSAQALREKDHPPGRGMRIASLAGETSDEIWPELEKTVLSLFPSVRPRGAGTTRKHSSAKVNVGGTLDSVTGSVKEVASAGVAVK